jgi:hypothetical protein
MRPCLTFIMTFILVGTAVADPAVSPKLIEEVTATNALLSNQTTCSDADTAAWGTFMKGAASAGVPKICSLKSFDDVCKAAWAGSDDEPLSTVDLQKIMKTSFYSQKKAYVEKFFRSQTSNVDLLNTCCGTDSSCKKSMTSVNIQWLPLGKSYPTLVDSTGYDPVANTIVFAEADPSMINAKYREDVETTVIHELGHACNHALFPGAKLGMFDAVEGIGGKKMLQCFLSDKDSFPFGPPSDGDFAEPLAEIALARFRPIATQWRSCKAFMYNLGLKCLFSTGVINSGFCK